MVENEPNHTMAAGFKNTAFKSIIDIKKIDPTVFPSMFSPLKNVDIKLPKIWRRYAKPPHNKIPIPETRAINLTSFPVGRRATRIILLVLLVKSLNLFRTLLMNYHLVNG